MRACRRAGVLAALALATVGCAGLRAHAPDVARQRWERAEAARRAGDFDAALAGYRAALAVDPSHVPAHRGYQDLLIAAGREDDVRAEYAALAEDPREPWSRVLYGRVLFDPQREEELYRAALAAAPDDRDAIAALGSALSRQLRFAEAADVLERGVAVAPGDPDMHLALAWAALCAGRGDEVRARYASASERAPDDPVPQRVLAMLAREAFDRDAVRLHLEAVVRVAPAGAAARRARVTLAELAQDWPAMLDGLRDLTGHPEHTPDDLVLAAGALWRWDEDDARVEEWLQEAQRLAPTAAKPLGRRALARVRSRDLLGVDELVREALRRDPNNVSALMAAAELAEMRKEKEGAVERYRHLLRVDEDPRTRRRLAKLLVEQGRPEEFLALLDEGFDLATLDLDDVVRRDDLLAREVFVRCVLGRWEEGAARGSARVEDPACSPLLLGASAEARWLGGDDVGALELLERAVARAGETEVDPETRAWLIALRVRDLLFSGRREEAYEDLRALREHPPDDLPDGYPLDAVLAALEASPEDADFFLRAEWPRVTAADKDRCLSDACRALIESGGTQIETDVQRALAEMPGRFHAAVDTLRKAGLDPVLFRLERDVVRELLREGHLVLVTTLVVREKKVAGHAALAVGYDDRLGIVLVEDVSLRGIGFLTDARIEGQYGLVLQGPAGSDLRARLPGVEYWDACLEAESLLAGSDWSGALQAIERALVLEAGGVQAHRLKARALHHLDRHEDELEWLRRASELEGAGILDHLILGHHCGRDEDVETLRVAVHRAAQRAAHTLPVRSLELELAAREKRHPIALKKAAERVLAIDELDARALYWRGYARLWAGEAASAIADLELSLGLQESADGWRYLADARSRAGDVPGAIVALERYSAIAAESGTAESDLAGVTARIAELQERLDGALAVRSP